MRPGIRTFRLKGVRRQKRPGDRVVKYHRETGIRLPDVPEDHPEFMAAWAKAEAGKSDPMLRVQKKAAPGSVPYVVAAFLLSPDFLGNSQTYMATMRRHAQAISASYPAVPFKAIAARHIEADIEKLPPHPANARLKTWRKLCQFAKRKGHAPHVATAGVTKRKTASGGHKPWTHADMAAYRERWPIGTVQRACFEFLSWTASRTNDAVRLSPSHVGKDGVLTFKQSKTGGPAYVPWTCALPDFASGWEAEREMVIASLACLPKGFTFLAAPGGRVRSFKGLSNIISDAAKEAKLIDCSAHGLRKFRLTAIAEAGGTAHAIMAWGGHKTLKEVEEYTRAAEMKRLITGTEQGRNVVSVGDTDTKTA